MEGQRVYHPQYGSGTAQFPRKSGLEYQVRFDTRDIRWIRVDELELEEASAGTATPVTPKRPVPENFANTKGHRSAATWHSAR